MTIAYPRSSVSPRRSTATTTTVVERSAKPKFFIHGERDEICPLTAMRAFYAQAADPKELVVIDAATTCSMAGSAKSPTPSKICWPTGPSTGRNDMQDAVIVSAVRTAVGKAPKALARHAADEFAATAIAEALRRAPGVEPAEIDDVDARMRDA